MKKVAVAALLVGFISSTTLAGTVSFGPSNAVVVDLGAGDSPVVTFDLTLTDFGVAAGYNAVDFLVGSNDLAMVSFNLDAAGVVVFFPGPTDPEFTFDTSTYTSGIKSGYFGTPSPTPTNQLLGHLTVDATGLADGVYSVDINADIDGGASTATAGNNVEPLFGSATVEIVPEPATLVLLAIGGLATALRRRRRA